MLPLLLSLIALALGVCALILAESQNRKLIRAAKHWRGEYDRVKALCDSIRPTHHSFIIVRDSYGSCAVCKKKNGLLCVIKAFIDSDTDFNLRQAEELVEKITAD